MSNENDPKAILQGDIQEFQEKLKVTPDEIEKIHGPFWNARYELAKNIVSLSSASLVLTLTFSKSISEPSGSVIWKWLLFGSWLAFLFSLCFAVLSLWISTNLKTAGPRFFNQGARIQQALDNLDVTGPDPLKELQSLIEDVLAPLAQAEVKQGRFLKISLIMFSIALGLLCALGLKLFAT